MRQSKCYGVINPPVWRGSKLSLFTPQDQQLINNYTTVYTFSFQLKANLWWSATFQSLSVITEVFRLQPMNFRLDSDFCLQQHVISSKLILVSWSHCWKSHLFRCCKGHEGLLACEWDLPRSFVWDVTDTASVCPSNNKHSLWNIWVCLKPWNDEQRWSEAKNKSCVNSILIWSMSAWQFIP